MLPNTCLRRDRGACRTISFFLIFQVGLDCISHPLTGHNITPTMQVCDYGDFVDGQCSTTTVTSPATETTTTVLAEDFGMHIVFEDLKT